MITAFVLVNVDVAEIPEAAQAIAELDGVREVHSVAGDWDLVVVVRVKEHEDLADVIANHLSKSPGVISTQTLIGFRAYSKVDLEAAFALGLD